MPLERSALTVADSLAWSQWLTTNGPAHTGVWLTLAKKGTTMPTSLSYPQALDTALCHGWIDGQRRRADTTTSSQSFTPRTPRSKWSKINVGHVARLEAEGRMMPTGRSAVEAAKADGRWDAAYAGSSAAQAPDDLLEALSDVKGAKRAWEGLGKGEKYAIYLQLSALKTVTGRKRRVEAIVNKLARERSSRVRRRLAPSRKSDKRIPSSGKT